MHLRRIFVSTTVVVAMKNSVMKLNFEMNKFSKLSGCILESKYKVKAIDTE